MKGWRKTAVLLLSLVLSLSVSCNPSGSKGGVDGETVRVGRGDLTVTVDGSGNIEIAREVKLAFGIAGRLDKIYVAEGDNVSQGAVLARLETDALKLALTQARVGRAEAQLALNQAQAVVPQVGASITQAQLALETAEFNLEQTKSKTTLGDIDIARSQVDVAQRDLDDALFKLGKYDPGTPGWNSSQEQVIQAQLRLNAAKDILDAMLTGTDTKEVAIKKLQVEAARQSLELAKLSLQLAQQAVEVARQSLELAEQSVAQAQRQLDKATLTAPFAGVVADIDAEEGDFIRSPDFGSKMIVHLIDPGSMELKVKVDEIDVVEVEVGQKAIIELDALPGRLVEGRVSFISPLPTVEAGVVTYEVKIKFDVAENLGLKTGMSATADIVTAERQNVLLVPDRAIRRDSQGNPVVEVEAGGQTEARPVVIGISDGVQTEITAGLKEGEVVVESRNMKETAKSGLFS